MIMADFLATPLLNEFFAWVLKTSLFASVMAGLILMIKMALNHRLKPGWHYMLWLLLLLRLIIPAGPQTAYSIYNLLPWVGTASQDALHPAVHTGKDHQAVSYPAEEPESMQAPVSTTEDSGPIVEGGWNAKKVVTGVWLIVTVIMLLRLPLVNAVFSIRLGRYAVTATPADMSLLQQAQRVMRIRRRVRLSYSPIVSTPTLFGWIRPRLIMPLNIQELDDKQKHHIYMHELAHMKHADIAVNWLMHLLLAVHWFNPVLWYALYKMREDQELAADAAALRNIDPAGIAAYGHTIITLLERSRLRGMIPGAAGVSGSKQQLKRRILMITTFKHRSFRWTLAGLVLVLALSGCALTNGKTPSDSNASAPSETTPAQEVTPGTPGDNGAVQDPKDTQNGSGSETSSTGGGSSSSGKSTGEKPSMSSGGSATRGHEQQIKDIYALAKKGQVKGANFVSGKTIIDDVHKAWGDPDRPWQPTDSYAYDSYSPGAGRGTYAFGIGRGEVVYDIRYFGSQIDESTDFKQISFTEIQKTLGKPGSIKTSGSDDILMYKVGDYELKFVGPHSTKRLDHISVYSRRAAPPKGDAER